MALTWPYKDPNEVLDYQLDWTDRLIGDTISTSSWTITGSDSVLTQDSAAISGDNAVIWLSSGTEGVRYKLTNRITTSGGRTMDQSVYLKVKSK